MTTTWRPASASARSRRTCGSRREASRHTRPARRRGSAIAKSSPFVVTTVASRPCGTWVTGGASARADVPTMTAAKPAAARTIPLRMPPIVRRAQLGRIRAPAGALRETCSRRLLGATAGGEPHQRRVEIDTRGGLLGAGRVTGERVLIAGPAAIGDSLLDPPRDDDGELRRGAPYPLTELDGGPVLRGGEHRGRQRERTHVREEGPHLLVDDERVAATAGGRREHDRLGDQEIVVEDVDERLEQPAEPGLVHRSRGDHRVGGGDLLDRGLQLGRGHTGNRHAGDVDGERSDLDGAERRGDVELPQLRERL